MKKILIAAVLLISYALGGIAHAQETKESYKLWNALSQRRFRDARLMVLKDPTLVNADINSGGRPLHAVCGAYADLTTAVFFIQKGAKVNAGDGNGVTALHFAIIRDRIDIVKLLVSKGALINSYFNRGTTAMHSAVGHERVFNYLLTKGGKINMQDRWGNTPLHSAAKRGDKRFCEFLLSKGADKRVKDNEGYTASEVARLRGNSVIADLLR